MGRALLTGAAGAIAGAFAAALRRADPGRDLLLLDHDAAGLERAAARLGGPVRLLVRDLSTTAGLEEGLCAELAGVDLLLNAAGIMEVLPVESAPFGAMERLLTVDLTAPLLLMRLVAGRMKAEGRGVILNVSSMAGVLPLRGCAYYGAAKAGLAMASEVARLELGRAGVDVITVYPGPVHSGLEARARAQFGGGLVARLMPTGDPDELAGLMLRAVHRREARVVYPRFYSAGERLPRVGRWVTSLLSPQISARR